MSPQSLSSTRFLAYNMHSYVHGDHYLRGNALICINFLFRGAPILIFVVARSHKCQNVVYDSNIVPAEVMRVDVEESQGSMRVSIVG